MAENLTEQAARGVAAAQIADDVVATWVAIDTALAPIIGRPSVAVLYMRSRHLVSRAHPWLRPGATSIVMDLPALRTLLAQQDNVNAAAGGAALLQTFQELLASLVGPSLTERLLDPVWTSTSSSGPTAQDPSP